MFCVPSSGVCFFFFFQAEDGIRDHCVTGVQTCALPISCDTFRAAAIEQIKLWGERLKIEVVASSYGADAAAVAHDAVNAAQKRKADYLFKIGRASCRERV